MITLNKIPQTSMDIVRLILINQMKIKADHVNIYNSKWNIPPFEDMFIVIQYLRGIPIANNNYFENCNPDENPQEIQVVNKLEKLAVCVMSRNEEAQQRKDEVSMAMMSGYSQFLQESWAFKIARVMPDEDLSYLEGASMLNRFDIEVSVYAWYQRTVSTQWMQGPQNIQVTASDAGPLVLMRTVPPLTALPTI